MLRIAVLLVLTLLFQQLALAAYACPIERMPARVTEAMPGCEGMAQSDPAALCEKHCNPDHSMQAAPQAASVPAITLPPLRFELAQTLSACSAFRAYVDVPPGRLDPPPLLRFCSLLI